MDLSLLAVIGRLLVGATFVFSGIRIVLARQAVAGLLTAKGVPAPLFVTLSGAVIEIVLGACLVLGLMVPLAAFLLAIFVVAATIMVHDFWRQQGMGRMQDENTAISNALIVGGLLVISGYPW